MTTKEYNKSIALWSDDAYRFALRLCDDVEAGKDAVQEALMALWQRCREVDFNKAKPFLLSTVYHKTMDYHRRHYREHQARGDLATEPVSTPHGEEHYSDPVERALRTLPAVQRAVLELADVEGYTYKEIAAALTLSDQQVRVYLYRARVALKKRLIEYGYNQ